MQVDIEWIFQRGVGAHYENRGFVVWISDVYLGAGTAVKKKGSLFIHTHTVDNNNGSFYKRTNAHICAGITSYTGIMRGFVKEKKYTVPIDDW